MDGTLARLLLLAGALVALAIALHAPVIGMVAVALAAAALLSVGWLRQVAAGLRLRRELPDELAFGEHAGAAIVLENRSLLRVPWLEVRDSVPLPLRLTPVPQRVLTLGAGATVRVEYTIRGGRRGWYTLGPLQVALGDPLGLERLRLSGPTATLVVYPRVVPLAELDLPAALLIGPLRGQRGEDPARPAGVRPYAPGDDIRRLDWKSSARQRTLLVRRADATLAPETTLAVAFGRQDYEPTIFYDALERAATAAASLAVALLNAKLPVSLVSNGRDPLQEHDGVALGWGKGDGQRRLLLRLLGRLTPGVERDLFEVLAGHPLPWGGTTVLVLSDLTPARLPAVLALRRRGQRIMLLLVEGTAAGLALARQHQMAAWRVGRREQPVLVRS